MSIGIIVSASLPASVSNPFSIRFSPPLVFAMLLNLFPFTSHPLVAQFEPVSFDHLCYCPDNANPDCDLEAIHESEPPLGCHNYAPGISQSGPFYCADNPPGPAHVEMSCTTSGCMMNGVMNGAQGEDPCGFTVTCNIISGGWFPAITVDLGFTTPGGVLCDYPGSTYDEGAVCTGSGTVYWRH